tara:strand:+ start:214 stop:372 length:159 start_codon:yes stop_codon:yes gene_type:complete
MKLERQILKSFIDKGKSVNDVALSTGKSKFTILKKAKEYGLKFQGKSYWANL